MLLTMAYQPLVEASQDDDIFHQNDTESFRRNDSIG